ncbi:fasciclin domain-containing protein [Ningiella sp. W23]|uniref:fasciclin domain-containing protein n=1 Tax=Ningiella sp. W23 TaxID=3023715 RepID=UPI003756D1BF
MKKQKTLYMLFVFVAIFTLQGCFLDDDDDDEVIAPTPPPPTVTESIVDIAVGNDDFDTLVAALQAADLVETLDNPAGTFTVFAPTDAAFALLGEDTINALLDDPERLTDILTYHVLSTVVPASTAINSAGSTVETVNGASVGLSLDGDSLLVNASTVVTTDIQASNGIIHVIDAVLIPPAERGEPSANIVDTAIGAGSFTTLVTALQATDLDMVLADESAQFTVFAPTDDAFAILGDETIKNLLDNPDVLSSILLQHVVADAQIDSPTAFSANGSSVETASGAQIPVSVNATTDSLTFGGANVVMTDIYTTNGIIHVIDMVVVADVELPEPAMSIVDVAVAAGSFTTLVAALEATGLDSVLADLDSEYTVFAPTDDAFALLGQDTIAALLDDPDTLSNILLYHVVSGATILQDAAVSVAQSDMSTVTMANEQMTALSLSGSSLFVNTSAVSAADIMASNGVIHVVDQVILPPPMRGEPTQNIVEVALSNPDFETLVAALTAADLVDTLADESASFTVFAPTDAAFDKIDDMALDGLLMDVDALSGVLLQHVLPAEVNSLGAFAANGSSVDTVGGEDVAIDIVNFTSFANDDGTEVAYDASNQRLVAGAGANNAGFTLYTFDNDLGTSTNNCSGTCAENWPPLLLSDGELADVFGLGTITLESGEQQITFQGRPLYYFAGDEAVGDANGQGLADLWNTVNVSQVVLSVQGSIVTTTDIYTSNGVIHVIDSVITETLEAGGM